MGDEAVCGIAPQTPTHETITQPRETHGTASLPLRKSQGARLLAEVGHNDRDQKAAKQSLNCNDGLITKVDVIWRRSRRRRNSAIARARRRDTREPKIIKS